MHSKTLFYLTLIGLCTACGSKNPGMSKEEAAKELSERTTTDQDAAPQAVTASVNAFPDDFISPAGIKYKPKIQKDRAVILNVPAALKNVRSVKVEDFGKMQFHFTGVDAMLVQDIVGEITPVGNQYVLAALQGLFLLSQDFKHIKQLFKNNVECKKHNGSMSLNPHQMITHTYYDASSDQLRCCYLSLDKGIGNQVAFLPFTAMVTASASWTPDDVTSKLPLDKKMSFDSFFNGFKEGFIKYAAYSGCFYTMGLKGDTLCCFAPEGDSDYTPKGTYRSGEKGNTYVYRNRTYIRMAYDNTVYYLEDASTLRAAYKLDFGTLRRPDGKKVTGSLSNNLDEDYFVTSWLETDRFLFIRITKGFDSSNARKDKQVSLYSLIYDKASKEFFSLPTEKEGKDLNYPSISAGNEQETSFYPKLVAGNTLLSYVNGKWIKENMPNLPEGKNVSDDELVLISVE